MRRILLKEIPLVCVLTAFILFFSFNELIVKANYSLLCASGDGLKNYYTFSYYLKHDSGFFFSGMNYPFGEHISYADAQPGISVLIRNLSEFFPELKNMGIGIINYAVIVGILIGVVSLFVLLRYFGVNPFLSFLGGIVVIILSPQLLRIEAHYALCYSFVFPLAWLLFLLSEKYRYPLYIIATIVLLIFSGFLHFYLTVISCLFLLSHSAICLIAERKSDSVGVHIIRWSIPILSIISIQLILWLTDPVKDRPSKPWGMSFYTAEPKTVFLPHPKYDLLNFISKNNPDPGEGFAYIGLLPFIFMLLLFGVIVNRIVRTKSVFSDNDVFSKKEYYMMASGGMILLFSFGIINLLHLDTIFSQFSKLNQFRSLGRFAWGFYYVISVFTIVGLSRWFRQHQFRENKGAYFIIVLLCSIWMAETIHRLNSLRGFTIEAKTNYNQIFEEEFAKKFIQYNCTKNKYQAVLSLPYFHIGSEKFSIENWSVPFIRTSFISGLPGLDVMLSRTSLKQTISLIQLTGNSLLDKNVIDRFPSKKPLLLEVYDNRLLNTEEKKLVGCGKYLFSVDNINYYELPVSCFDNNETDSLQTVYNQKKDLYKFSNYYSTDSFSNACVKFFGLNYVKDNFNKKVLLDTSILYWKRDDTIAFSLWARIPEESDRFPYLKVTEYNNQKEIDKNDFLGNISRDIFYNEVNIAGIYPIKNNMTRLRFELINGQEYHHLLIKRKDENIFIPVSEKMFLFNNFPVRINE